MQKILLIILLSYSLLSCNSHESTTNKREDYHYTVGKVTYNFSRKFTIKLEEIKHTEAPIKSFWLKFQQGNLWAANNQKLVKFDKDLNANLYGKQGGGPEENELISFFWIEEKAYAVFDFAKQRLAYFDFQDKFIEEIKFDKGELPFIDFFGKCLKNDNIITLNEIFVTKNDKKERDIFISVLNKDGKILKRNSLKDLLKIEPKKNALDVLLDGEFLETKNYNVYFFYKIGKFLVYDILKNEFLIYNTIDETPIPKTKSIPMEGGGFKFSTDPPNIFFPSATVSEQYLYLLSTLEKKENRTIDYYSLVDGKYQGSIKIPNFEKQLPSLIAVDEKDKFLWIEYEDLGLVKYQMNLSSM